MKLKFNLKFFDLELHIINQQALSIQVCSIPGPKSASIVMPSGIRSDLAGFRVSQQCQTGNLHPANISSSLRNAGGKGAQQLEKSSESESLLLLLAAGGGEPQSG